jgi:hypothetical protein
MYRQLVYFRKAYKYFSENKSWILSTLFIFSIIKDCVWYACFGINILTFSSIQDTFISFFNYLIIFAIATLIYIFLNLFPFKKASKTIRVVEDIIKFVLFLFLISVYFFLFKKIAALITVLFYFIFVKNAFEEKKYLQLTSLLITFLIVISMFEPLIQYNYILNKFENNGTVKKFNLDEGNMEFFSFTYKNKKYDTKSKRYFLIGNTTNYIFLFDNSRDKSLIFPKGNCENIESEVFIFCDFNKF